MREIGFLVQINELYPDKMNFTLEEAKEVAGRFKKNTKRKLERLKGEDISSSRIAAVLAEGEKETKEEILARVRSNINAHWQEHYAA